MGKPFGLGLLRVQNWWYALVAAVLLGAARPSATSFGLGLVTVAAGEALRSWGAGHLVKNARFSVTGPYAHLRHPLYAGTLIIGVGFALTPGGWVSAAAIAMLLAWFFFVYFPRKERIESARLERRYGRIYADYRARVPALVPSPSAWGPPPDGAPRDELGARWSARRFFDNNEQGTLLGVAFGLGIFALRSLIPL